MISNVFANKYQRTATVIYKKNVDQYVKTLKNINYTLNAIVIYYWYNDKIYLNYNHYYLSHNSIYEILDSAAIQMWTKTVNKNKVMIYTSFINIKIMSADQLKKRISSLIILSFLFFMSSIFTTSSSSYLIQIYTFSLASASASKIFIFTVSFSDVKTILELLTSLITALQCSSSSLQSLQSLQSSYYILYISAQYSSSLSSS